MLFSILTAMKRSALVHVASEVLPAMSECRIINVCCVHLGCGAFVVPIHQIYSDPETVEHVWIGIDGGIHVNRTSGCQC